MTMIENATQLQQYHESIQGIPQFSLNELKKGKILGTGGCATIFEIQKFAKQQGEQRQPSSSDRSDQRNNFQSFRSRLTRLSAVADSAETRTSSPALQHKNDFEIDTYENNDKKQQYVLKIVKPEAYTSPKDLKEGLQGIMTEVIFLSQLDHPNIIHMRAVGHSQQTCSNTTVSTCDFYIMDRIYNTLENKIETWKAKDLHLKNKKWIVDRKGVKRRTLFLKRLEAARDLSSALSYMHKKRCIHRDLKSQNIGFDRDGKIQLLDFGRARILPATNHASLKEETYGDKAEGAATTFLMTGFCGSPRYMAPEVGKSLPYNETCDVYSFSLLFWIMLKMEKPFQHIPDIVRMHETVWKSDPSAERPPMNPKWSTLIRDVMCQGWSFDILERPSMTAIESFLTQQVKEQRCRLLSRTGVKGIK